MANNLKKKLVRENPVIARLQDPKYQRVNFLRGVNRYINWRYPTERQLDVATRIMDEFDESENLQPLTNLNRTLVTGQVVTIRKCARNKAFYNLLVVKRSNDPRRYLIRETKALAGVKVGQSIRATASLVPSPKPGDYFLSRPTKTEIV